MLRSSPSQYGGGGDCGCGGEDLTIKLIQLAVTSKLCPSAPHAEAVKADSMTGPKKVAERNKLWGSIFTRAMDEAPWVPYLHQIILAERGL